MGGVDVRRAIIVGAIGLALLVIVVSTSALVALHWLAQMLGWA